MHNCLRYMGGTIAEEKQQGTQPWGPAHLSTVSNNINFLCLLLNGGNPQRLKMLYRPALHHLHLQKLPIGGISEDKACRKTY